MSLDAIIYDLKDARWNETIYDQAMKSGVLRESEIIEELEICK